MKKNASAPLSVAPNPAARTAGRPRALASGAAPCAAEVLSVEGEDIVFVRRGRASAEAVMRAEIAVMGYVAAPGDRVLVLGEEGALFVVGVLGEARRRKVEPLGAGLVARATEDGVELRAASGQLTIAASALALRADRVEVEATLMTENVGKLEVQAERIATRAQDVYTRVDGLVETTAGRARTLVSGDHDLVAKKTNLVSEEDTQIDGRRVLLG